MKFCNLSFLFFSLIFSSSLTAQETGGPYTPDAPTVLLMHFDGDAGNSVSGGNNGIIHGSGVSFVQSDLGFGECLRIDNSTPEKHSWIEIPYYSGLNVNEEFSIECWFKINSWGEVSTGTRSLFKKEDSSGNLQCEVILNAANNSLQANLDCVDDENSIWGADAGTAKFLELNKWYHIAVYYNYSHKHLYCLIRDENYQEIFASRGYSETPPVTGDGKFTIGFGGWDESYFDGWIDELRISNIYRKYRDDVLADVDKDSFAEEIFIPLKDRWVVGQWPLDAYYPVDNVTGQRYTNFCGPTMLMRTIHFWEYPRKPSGLLDYTIFNLDWYADYDNTEYNFDLIPPQFSPYATEEEYGPAATFSYQVGAASMEYFDNMYCMPFWLKKIFHFDKKTRVLFREEYTKEEWQNIFKNELNNGRPVMVGAVASRDATGGGGHYYIVNGYNKDNLFFTDHSFNDQIWVDIDNFPYGISQDIIVFLEPDLGGKSLNLISPEEGEYYMKNTSLEIRWESENVSTLLIEYSSDAGKTWNIAAEEVDAGQGLYSWTIPGLVSEKYKIRISDTWNPNLYRISGLFNVYEQQEVSFLYPDNSTVFQSGTTNPVYWDSEGIKTIKIEYSGDGQNWVLLKAPVLCSDNMANCFFPAGTEGSFILKATSIENSDQEFLSENFTITTLNRTGSVNQPDENSILLMHFEQDVSNSAENEIVPAENKEYGDFEDNFALSLGKAFRINNSPDSDWHCIIAPNSELFNLGNTWTIETWVKIAGVGTPKTQFPIIIDKGGSFGLNLDGNGNGFGAYAVFTNNTELSFFQNQALQTGEWYHIALVSDNSTHTVSFFVHDKNSDLIYEETKDFPDGSNGEMMQTTNDLFIGGVNGGSNIQFDGWLDEINISKSAKDFHASEIEEIPFFDDFSNGYEKWSAFSVAGDDQWHLSGDDGIDGSMCARFYVTSEPAQANDDWLVSRVFNTSTVSKLTVRFKYWYHGNGIIPQFYYSTTYSGNPSTNNWIPVDNSFWQGEWTWNQAVLEINDPGETFVLGIRYQNTGEISSYILIDNLAIEKSSTGLEMTKSRENSLRVYPNPVTENSKIEFINPVTGFVSLDVCDSRGVSIWQVVNCRLMPGTYTFPVDKTRFKNGIYIVTLSGPTGMASIKLIVND